MIIIFLYLICQDVYRSVVCSSSFITFVFIHLFIFIYFFEKDINELNPNKSYNLVIKLIYKKKTKKKLSKLTGQKKKRKRKRRQENQYFKLIYSFLREFFFLSFQFLFFSFQKKIIDTYKYGLISN